MRLIEAVVLVLIATIGVCYFIEIFVLPQTQPNFPELARWLFAPDLPAFVAQQGPRLPGDRHHRRHGDAPQPLPALGARAVAEAEEGRRIGPPGRALQHDRHVGRASVAFFVNAAILVLAAVVFFGHDRVTLPSGQVVAFTSDSDWIQIAYVTLAPLVGKGRRQPALRDRAARQRPEQHDHRHARGPGGDGGLHALEDRAMDAPADHAPVRDHPGDHPHRPPGRQQRDRPAHAEPGRPRDPAAAGDVPALAFAGSRRRMGEGRIGGFLLVAGWASCLLITALDIYGLPGAMHDAIGVFAGH
jgi:manganese transport protein